MLPNRKGQSLTEVALGLGVIAIVIFALIALLGSNNVTPDATRSLIAGTDLESEVDVNNNEYPSSIDYSQSHGDNHAEYTEASKCFSKHGTAQTWRKPLFRRKASICYEGDRFFIQILEKKGDVWYEVTKFLRPQARSLGDAGTYLKNNGYVR
jgi:hypothetical protein